MGDIAHLLPEMAEWQPKMNARQWVSTELTSGAAVAFSEIFWPKFSEYEGHVFIATYALSHVRELKERGLGQGDTEKFVNWIYVNEYLFRDGEEMSAADERRDLFDARCRYIGKILKDIYAFKLARDFPHLQFVVSLEDGSNAEGEVSLTFWQTDK